MDVKPVSGKCCFFMKKKTGYLLMACSLLVFQTIVEAQALLWITEGWVSKIQEVDTKDSWDFVFLVLYIVLDLAISITTISLMVVLLVGLHKGDTRLIKTYLTISTIVFPVIFSFDIMSQLAFKMSPIIYVQRMLFMIPNGFLLTTSLNYWHNLMINIQVCEDA